MTQHLFFKQRLTLIAAAFLMIIGMLIALSVGRYELSLRQVFGILTNTIPSTAVNQNVVLNIRLPRVLAAAGIGAALALSGTAYQGIFQNPLVSPDLLGVSNGAAVGAALAILLNFQPWAIQILAFIFGISAVLLTMSIPKLMHQRTTLTLVLAGIIVSGLMQACLGLIKYLVDPDSQLQSIVFWQLGSLAKVTLTNLLTTLPLLIIGTIILCIMRWRLTVISLGDSAAGSLGINLRFERLLIILCATILTAASVCISGTIGWIGLVVPHVARLIIGPNPRYALPLAGLVGALFLVIVDTLARTISAGEIPLSILTGFIGTPIFIYILLSKRVKL
ncbi:FecCD family ABC transporter permease [Lentilactobacillus farraginis]|nr:iron ABC transporter permease [Lentilactobacillus farraginis]